MAAISKTWFFASSSGKGTYETIQYSDGSISCNCPGWTRRAERTCKHTRMVQAGVADREAIQSQAITPAPILPKIVPVTGYGRKFAV